MDGAFDWDPVKARANLQRHGVAFTEAATAFADPASITVPDPYHSAHEDRYILIGRSNRGRLLVVIHVDQSDAVIRLISARPASRHERKQYEEEAV